MLVAEKQQYLEAYDPRIDESTQVVEKPKDVSKPNVKRKAKTKNKITPIVTVLVGFALCSLTVARYAMIAQNHSDILKLEQALEAEYKKEERLKLELNYGGDLNRIEEYAKNNLEMDYPDENQVLYVELPRQEEYEADKGTEDGQVKMANRDEETLWDKIISLLD